MLILYQNAWHVIFFQKPKQYYFSSLFQFFALVCDRFSSTRSPNYHNKGHVLIFRPFAGSPPSFMSLSVLVPVLLLFLQFIFLCGTFFSVEVILEKQVKLPASVVKKSEDQLIKFAKLPVSGRFSYSTTEKTATFSVAL